MAAAEHDAPTPPAPAPPPVTAIVPALVAWLINISTWKRAFIAMLLGITSLCVVLAYQHPARVFQVLDGLVRPRRSSQTATYMTPLFTDVQKQLTLLQRTFAPAMIGVGAWRVDLATNRQQFVTSAALPDFRDTVARLERERWQVPTPVFGANPVVNHLMGSLIAGRFACAPATGSWPVLTVFPLAEVCLIGIPPEEGEGLTGFIGGGWREPIPEPDRRRIETAFRAAASQLVWRYPVRR